MQERNLWSQGNIIHACYSEWPIAANYNNLLYSFYFISGTRELRTINFLTSVEEYWEYWAVIYYLSLLSVTIKPVFIVQNEREDVALLIKFLLKIGDRNIQYTVESNTNPLITSACDLFTKVISVFLLCVFMWCMYIRLRKIGSFKYKCLIILILLKSIHDCFFSSGLNTQYSHINEGQACPKKIARIRVCIPCEQRSLFGMVRGVNKPTAHMSSTRMTS